MVQGMSPGLAAAVVFWSLFLQHAGLVASQQFSSAASGNATDFTSTLTGQSSSETPLTAVPDTALATASTFTDRVAGTTSSVSTLQLSTTTPASTPEVQTSQQQQTQEAQTSVVTPASFTYEPESTSIAQQTSYTYVPESTTATHPSTFYSYAPDPSTVTSDSNPTVVLISSITVPSISLDATPPPPQVTTAESGLITTEADQPITVPTTYPSTAITPAIPNAASVLASILTTVVDSVASTPPITVEYTTTSKATDGELMSGSRTLTPGSQITQHSSVVGMSVANSTTEPWLQKGTQSYTKDPQANISSSTSSDADSATTTAKNGAIIVSGHTYVVNGVTIGATGGPPTETAAPVGFAQPNNGAGIVAANVVPIGVILGLVALL